MKDKIVVITGANSGIGKATAIGLAEKGAQIVMLCRNPEKAEKARDEIVTKSGNPKVVTQHLDLADLSSVRVAAKALNASLPRIDVLINNAGGYFGRRQLSKDGYEYTFAMNHLGHFLLTDLLMDLLMKANGARIINVSSEAQRMGHINFDDLHAEKKYSGIKAYAQAKLANIIFTKELARRLKGDGITVNALHPGVVNTGFGKDAVGLTKILIVIFKPLMLSARKGAKTSVYLASSDEVTNETGKFWAKCKEKAPIPEADDVNVQHRLWEVSEELVKIN